MSTSLRLALVLLFVLLLTACGGSDEEPTPTEVNVLTIHYWQAPSVPSPYLSGGNKDTDAAAVTLEPLAKYDPEGNIVPALAAEIPTIENGGVSRDLMSITWKLKEGLKWSDGTDVTAEDVSFTWLYCDHEETGCTSESSFDGIASVQALDDLTVQIKFVAPTPYPYQAFVGSGTPIISSVQFADCIGAAASTCLEQNYAPLGTGPYRITNFQPNDRIAYERNPHYHGTAPYFDHVILKSGGNATAAARSVLETGDVDYAWNVQVEPETLTRMQEAGLGQLVVAYTSLVERIVLNQTNPDRDLGDNRSEYLDGKNPHPFLTFKPIRQAMSMAIDRDHLAKELYGFAGEATCNLITGPQTYVSNANDACLPQDIEGAKRLLDENKRARHRRRRHPGVQRSSAKNRIPDLHQLHPAGHPGPHSRLVAGDRHQGKADRPRCKRLLRRRPRGRQERVVPQVLRRRADVRFRHRNRPAAGPVRSALQTHPHPRRQLGPRERRPFLRPRLRRTLYPAGTGTNRPRTRGANQAAERPPRAELL